MTAGEESKSQENALGKLAKGNIPLLAVAAQAIDNDEIITHDTMITEFSKKILCRMKYDGAATTVLSGTITIEFANGTTFADITHMVTQDFDGNNNTVPEMVDATPANDLTWCLADIITESMDKYARVRVRNKCGITSSYDLNVMGKVS